MASVRLMVPLAKAPRTRRIPMGRQTSRFNQQRFVVGKVQVFSQPLFGFRGRNCIHGPSPLRLSRKIEQICDLLNLGILVGFR